MFNLDDITNKYNSKKPYIPDHLYRILIIIRKTKCIIKINNSARRYYEIFLYWKRLEWTNIWIFDWKTWKCRDKTFKWCKSIHRVFKYSNIMDYVYEDIDEYNIARKRKTPIDFDDMMANNMSNKNFKP